MKSGNKIFFKCTFGTIVNHKSNIITRIIFSSSHILIFHRAKNDPSWTLSFVQNKIMKTAVLNFEEDVIELACVRHVVYVAIAIGRINTLTNIMSKTFLVAANANYKDLTRN